MGVDAGTRGWYRRAGTEGLVQADAGGLVQEGWYRRAGTGGLVQAGSGELVQEAGVEPDGLVQSQAN